MPHKIGSEFYSNEFQMDSEELLERKVLKVYDDRGRAWPSEFEIAAGPLTWRKTVSDHTYIVEVRHKPCEGVQVPSNFLATWNNHLFLAYAEKATELAEEFCEDNGLDIHDTFSSYPVYQAIASKTSQD